MFLLGAVTNITWVLSKTSSTVLLADLDILIIDPLGVITYLTAPIQSGDFTAPTPTVAGSAAYNFTPLLEGKYKLRLVKGTASSYTVFSKVEMYVMDNTTVVRPIVAAGSSGGTGVPDGGTTGQILIKQSSTDGDALWQDNTSGSVTIAPGEYCPGYPITGAANGQITIGGVDATSLFSVGREVKVNTNSPSGIVNDTIATSDFNNPDTVLSLTTNGGTTLGYTDLCLSSSTVSWVPIANSPFGGTQINKIVSGVISSVNYWVAVGNDGKAFSTTDEGLNWNTIITGTTEHLNAIDYCSDTEQFLIVGNARSMLLSSDGLTVVVKIPSAIFGVTTIFQDVLFVPSESRWMVALNVPGGNHLTYSISVFLEINTGGNWSSGAVDSSTHSRLFLDTRVAGDDIVWATAGNLSNLSSTTTTSETTLFTYSGKCFAAVKTSNTSFDWVTATDLGEVLSRVNSTQTTITVPQPIRAMALSASLGRIVMVGDNSFIGTVESADYGASVAVTQRTNGFSPAASILDVHWDENVNVFVAVSNNGQICKSTNGLA